MRIPIVPDKDLHLAVFLTRRTMHAMFPNNKAVKAKLPLVVKVRDPKEDKEKLLNLANREEFYGLIDVIDPKVKIVQAILDLAKQQAETKETANGLESPQ